MQVNLAVLSGTVNTVLGLAGTYLLAHSAQLVKSLKAHVDAKTAAIQNPTERAAAQAGEQLLGSAIVMEGPTIEKTVAKLAPQVAPVATLIMDGITAAESPTGEGKSNS